MEEKIEKGKIMNFFVKIFWIFMIGSFLGFVAETIVVLIKEGHYECRQGLLYGPFVQIYGIGAVVYYLFVPKIKKSKNVFWICMIVGGILEYLFSYIQEVLFGTISWDYSNYFLNLNGRTSLLHCIYWGIAGILVDKVLCPFVDRTEKYMKNKIFKQITIIIAIFMLCNITISWSAANRQEERMKKIPPRTKFDYFLDKHYPNEVMDKIYANKIDKLKNN